jgi:Inner membrane component of T3SS, cytoplasmic domain
MPEKMTRCPEGHFYDPAKHNSCPWCALPADSGGGEQKTKPVHAPPAMPVTPASAPSAGAHPAGAGATVRYGMSTKAEKADPVVGWLVCLEGADRGRDYRLHAEKNFIGRAPHMDIAIENDNTVSREKHAVVVFDPKKQTFWLLPGEASGLVYLNGEMINSPAPIKRDDVLEVGQTKLVLFPFCGDKYSWNEPVGA